MKFPVLVNVVVKVPQPDGAYKTDLNRVVLDFHYKGIAGFSNAGDGSTLVCLKVGERYEHHQIAIDFEAMYQLYNMQDPIDEQFKEEVDAYAKDNLDNYMKAVRKGDL
jgi:hypothetical protein